MTVTNPIATGFAARPLTDGNILVEFQDDGGRTLSSQIISADLLKRIPVVALLTHTAMSEGIEAVIRAIETLNGGRGTQGETDGIAGQS